MSFKLFLGIGTAAIAIVTYFAGNRYGLSIWKMIAITLLEVALGVLGTYIMGFIESGQFKDRSFYGAIFFSPIMLIPFGVILRIKPLELLDLYAPSVCAMSAIMKVNCYLSDCCIGKVMYHTENGKAIRFPSQLSECAAAVIILLILFAFIRQGKKRGSIYFWLLILYGIARFILNLFRETKPFIWNLAAGNFWSLISVTIGCFLLLLWRYRIQKRYLAI